MDLRHDERSRVNFWEHSGCLKKVIGSVSALELFLYWERERRRERDRERGLEREVWPYVLRDRQTDRDKLAQRQTDRQIDRDRQRQTDREGEVWPNYALLVVLSHLLAVLVGCLAGQLVHRSDFMQPS